MHRQRHPETTSHVSMMKFGSKVGPDPGLLALTDLSELIQSARTDGAQGDET